ncbi:MAG TPA: hypothetical protein VFJ06_01270 [Halococcus sp.]|nr:hypothetical protein [Halococcus sp.]
MTNTERLRGLISTLKRIGGRLARYAPAGALAVWIAVLSMATPAAAQGLCSIPGAAGPLSLGFGIIVSVIAAVALFKFGGTILKGITGGGRGNAKLRIGAILALIGLFVAVGADSIVPWVMQQLGGSPGSVDIGCMIGGGGGGGGGG